MPQSLHSSLYDPAFEHDSCGIGFVAHLHGEASHRIIDDARTILINMAHRGAVGAEANSGDGAGVMTSLPHHLIAAEFHIPQEVSPGTYALAHLFLPRSEREQESCRRQFTSLADEVGLRVWGWRRVPTNNGELGPTARSREPAVWQALLVRETVERFSPHLYRLRKRAMREIRRGEVDPEGDFYLCSLSTTTVVYKGMLTPRQLFSYYPDLTRWEYRCHVAVVHSRFSTNTFPSWDRAQPLRYMSHNGEINTLQGNVNKMRGREGRLESPDLSPYLSELLPIIEPDLSDSGSFDAVLELLVESGFSIPEAVMMMVPEAWHTHRHMPPAGRAMYQFMSAKMEPWDGPASISFTDGRVVGALLDRNGLRPSRYYITTDRRVIMASEVGVLPIDPRDVVRKGRLEPGRMFLVDFERGSIVEDTQLKDAFAAEYPFERWCNEGIFTLTDLPIPPVKPNPGPLSDDDRSARLRAAGYTREDLSLVIAPMVRDGKEALGSMGNDVPLAVLDEQPRLVYEYVKQRFAQVTNPPIDSIREVGIMSLGSFVGPEGNLLSFSPHDVARLWLDDPILLEDDLARLRGITRKGWSARVIDTTFPVNEGAGGVRTALESLVREAHRAVKEKVSVIVLSDRAVAKGRVALPALLAVAAVHHALVASHTRTRVALVVDSIEPREVHHMCCLLGFGADAICPWGAYEAINHLLSHDQEISSLNHARAYGRYREALRKGMRKVFGKMGISTLESYKGAQIFEIVGLHHEVVEVAFRGCPSRIEGVGFSQLGREALHFHRCGWPVRAGSPYRGRHLGGGNYQWRASAHSHMWSPEAISYLQRAVQSGDRAWFERYSECVDGETAPPATLRSLLSIAYPASHAAISIDSVEPAEQIVRRFVTGAMSYGSISAEAHEALAQAMNLLGGKSNTGEGGEQRERLYDTSPNGGRSAIKQVASGRFGVTIEYLTHADEIQIKMAQGAKPGEGGELPGHKVFDEIARTRYSTPGVGLISPPPHHDIYSIEDLAQLIFDLKSANPAARISVKLVSEVGVGTIAAGVAKAHADHILISGHDGGTGASPLTGIKNAGSPWEVGLAEVHQTLVRNGLRNRVVLQTDGQIKTGRDVAIAIMLGAEEVGFATSALVSLGCIMMRKCQNNTCPVGVATQDPRLRARFSGKPQYVIRMMHFVAEQLREIMARLGIARWDDLVGRTEFLREDERRRTWKSEGVTLSALLSSSDRGGATKVAQDHQIEGGIDQMLLDFLLPREKGGVFGPEITVPIANTDRAVGAILSHNIVRRYGGYTLPPDSARATFLGSAGQSFGAWLAQGITFRLEGDANDYLGKGLSGGMIIVYPPHDSPFVAEDNIIIGNVACYGATSGEVYIRGVAAERFGVRNSGATIVAEGVGDHGLEYMTGGTAVILGAVGRNFAAGMSGGVAYVWDPRTRLDEYLNGELVERSSLSPSDDEALRQIVTRHARLTSSEVASRLLSRWEEARGEFVRVISPMYRAILKEAKGRSLCGQGVIDG